MPSCAQDTAKRYISQCSWDGENIHIPDPPATQAFTNTLGLQLRVHYQNVPGPDGRAVLNFIHRGHVIKNIQIDDFNNPNGWIAIAPKRFAISWSNGGAAGGWSTRIFRVDTKGQILEDTTLISKVTKDFSSRHHCVERGENYQAIRWMDNDHLLMTAEVYPASDCAEMGYTEGYMLNLATSRIEKKMSEDELISLPYVCTWNAGPSH